MKNLFFNLIIAFLLSGCESMFKPLTLDLRVPDGPPEYQAGWHDGCSSALSVGGFTSAKFHNLTMGNGAYQHDQVYIGAWGSGWFACVTQAGGYTSFPGMNRGPLE